MITKVCLEFLLMIIICPFYQLDEIDRSIIEVNQLMGVASVAVTTKPRGILCR